MVRYRELIMLGSSLATLRSYPEHVRYSFGTIARYVCESERTQLYEAIQEAIPMQQEMKFVKNWPPVKFSEKNFPLDTGLAIHQLSVDDPEHFYRFLLAPYARNPESKAPEFVLMHTYIKKSNKMPTTELDTLKRNIKTYLKR